MLSIVWGSHFADIHGESDSRTSFRKFLILDFQHELLQPGAVA